MSASGMYAIRRNIDGTYSVQNANDGTWVALLAKDKGDALVNDWFGADVLRAVLKFGYFWYVSRAEIMRTYQEEFADA